MMRRKLFFLFLFSSRRRHTRLQGDWSSGRVLFRSASISPTRGRTADMFKILQKTLRAGTVTQPYPEMAAKLAAGFRGLPEFDLENWRDARPAADACPTGAIAVTDAGWSRTVTVDYGRCILCGECAAATPEGAVRIGQKFEAAVTDRKALVISAEYTLDAEGRQTRLVRSSPQELGPTDEGVCPTLPPKDYEPGGAGAFA